MLVVPIVRVDVLLVSPLLNETVTGLNVIVAPPGRVDSTMLRVASNDPEDPEPVPRVTVTVKLAGVPGLTALLVGLTETDPTLGASVNVVVAVLVPSVATTRYVPYIPSSW